MRFIYSMLLGVFVVACVAELIFLGVNNFDLVFKFVIAPAMLLGSLVFFVVLLLSFCVLCWGIGKYILDKIDKIKYEKTVVKEVSLEEFCSIIHRKQLRGNYSSIGSHLNGEDITVFYKIDSVLKDNHNLLQYIHRLVFENGILVQEENIFIGFNDEVEKYDREITPEDLMGYNSPKEFWEGFILANEKEIFKTENVSY